MNQSKRTQENKSSSVQLNQVLPTAPIDIQLPIDTTKHDLINKYMRDCSTYKKDNYTPLSHSTLTWKSEVQIHKVLPTAPIDIKLPIDTTKRDMINKHLDDCSTYIKKNYTPLSHSTPTCAMRPRNFQGDIVSDILDSNAMESNQNHNYKRHFPGPIPYRKSRRRTFPGSDIVFTDSDIFPAIKGGIGGFNKENLYSKENLFHSPLESCSPSSKVSKLNSNSSHLFSNNNNIWLPFQNEAEKFSISAPIERDWHRRKSYNSNPIQKCSESSSAVSNSLPKHYKDYEKEFKSRSSSENSLTDEDESSNDDSYWLWANYMFSEGLWHS